MNVIFTSSLSQSEVRTKVKREGVSSSASEDDTATLARRKAQLAAATKLKDTESPLVCSPPLSGKGEECRCAS